MTMLTRSEVEDRFLASASHQIDYVSRDIVVTVVARAMTKLEEHPFGGFREADVEAVESQLHEAIAQLNKAERENVRDWGRDGRAKPSVDAAAIEWVGDSMSDGKRNAVRATAEYLRDLGKRIPLESVIKCVRQMPEPRKGDFDNFVFTASRKVREERDPRATDFGPDPKAWAREGTSFKR
jgi:hypothetical protein